MICDPSLPLVLWQCVSSHHCLWPLVEHRPPTRALKASRSWASLSSCPQVQRILFVSASRSRRQAFLGWSRFLLPCGFQVKSWGVIQVSGFWRVCPIHLQHLWRISSSAACCLVCFQSSLLLMVSGHRIRRILLRQVLMNVWILFRVAAVILHVSAPYSRTGFTLVLKILILMLMVRLGEAQISRTATLALPILTFYISISPPLFVNNATLIGETCHVF